MMNALADKIPMIVFCGQVATSAIGTDGFQEANVLAMSQTLHKVEYYCGQDLGVAEQDRRGF